MKKQLLLLLCLFSGSLWLRAQENYNMQFQSHLPFANGVSCANIWGYADSLGNEYALVGTSFGLSIINVTDPANPFVRFNVNSVNNFWREVKTWEGFAYVTTEGDGAGLLIVDLRSLPDTIYTRSYFGDGAINNQLSTIHALHIDNARCYLYGSNIGVGGIVTLDLTDPWNPTYMGNYNTYYVHDGIVYGDTAWAGNIYNGFFTVLDMANPAAPVELAQQETPGNFTHNTWLSDDRKYLLTTDEVSNSYLTSYRIDDLGNITELDRYQTAPGSNCIVHNTLVKNDWAVTSWYTEGVAIVDNNHPDNLIEVAKYDFSTFEGDGFNGCWGVYPYLPSGNILASDIETGLWVFSPTYVRACYLEGIVYDSLCAEPLEGVTVTIVGRDSSELSGFDGVYKTGTAFPGTYTVTFSKPGYDTVTLTDVALENGVTTSFEVHMYSDQTIALDGLVQQGGNAVENALVSVSNSQYAFNFTTDANGTYERCDVLPGNYVINAGAWGYKTNCISTFNLSPNNANPVSDLTLGYYDDFVFNFGWTVSNTATAGFWERAVPVGTTNQGATSNANADANGDCNGIAFVTGNAAGTQAGSDDVDGGCTVLVSPAMDLSTYTIPVLKVHTWFYNGGGTGAAVNDTFYLYVRQNQTETLLKAISASDPMSSWQAQTFTLNNYLSNFEGDIRFVARACDLGAGHLVEAGIDLFEVQETFVLEANKPANGLHASIAPNPSNATAQVLTPEIANSIEVMDLSGRIIWTCCPEGNQVTLPSHIPAGTYLVHIQNKNATRESLRWIKF
jgi:choice-of-anchor B domain-containing protein